MRTLTVLCVVLLFSAFASAQVPTARGGPGNYWGPYVPLVTTPSVSFETVSANPVGATNATPGLVAGATNSTLSMVTGNTDSVHTQAVWYSGGGSPLIAPPVFVPVAGPMAERGHHEAAREQKQGLWGFIAASERVNAVEAAAEARGGKKATRTFTNQDIERLKPPDNTVQYNGKTEKL